MTHTDAALVQPRDVMLHWLIALTEPLIPTGRRRLLEDQVLALSSARPRWTATFAGGVLSDIAHTLPETDPWRALTARWGATRFGPGQAPADGAFTPQGRRFGNLEDATDVSGQVMSDPHTDPGLAAVAGGLNAPAAFALATSQLEPDTAARALLALKIPSGQADQHPDQITNGYIDISAAVDEAMNNVYSISLKSEIPSAEQSIFGESIMTAIRWVIYRRKSWLATHDDDFVFETFARWTTITDDLMRDRDTSREMAARAASITAHSIEPFDPEF